MAAIERIFAAAPIPGGRAGFVPVPFQFLVTGEDNLRVTVYNRRANSSVLVQGRFLPRGETQILAFQHELRPPSDGSEFTAAFPLGDGVILNLLAREQNNAVERGQLFARVDIIRGLTGATITLGTLISGYIGSALGRAWPGSPLEFPVEGPGHLDQVSGTTPAAGAAPILNQPDETVWGIIAANVTLTTSAVPGTRQVLWELLSLGVRVGLYHSSIAQGASTALSHSIAAGQSHTPGTGVVVGVAGLPADCRVSKRIGNDPTLRIVATGLDAGDQFSAINALIEVWANPITTAG